MHAVRRRSKVLRMNASKPATANTVTPPPSPTPAQTQHAPLKTALLTLVALCAFAGNSLLCRAALAHGAVDAHSFTWLRLASGAVFLALLISLNRAKVQDNATDPKPLPWRSAAALWVYAAAFSMAYIDMGAATGALVLFGSVQITMTTWGLWRGERFVLQQWLGYLMAIGGLTWLLLPGASAPPLGSAALMTAAGVAWGAYSILGKSATRPVLATASNFRYAVLPATVLLVWALSSTNAHISGAGTAYALASGALASGAGYAIWYAVLPRLGSTTAASLQLSVPIITALAAVLLLNEPLSGTLIVSSAIVLGGIGLVIGVGKTA